MRILPIAVVFSLVLVTSSSFAQRRVDVATAETLRGALQDARPGDEIVLATGTYEISGNLRTRAAGTSALPITVRSDERHGALVRFDSDGGFVEGFVVGHAFWVFDGLRVEGRCADHSRCEHAWHIVDDADAVIFRHNEAFNFNAHIKGNGGGDSVTYPDDVLVLGNHFYNTAPRQTANPVTPIDVVGGRRWIVRANYIHDYEKAQGNNVSYAAFLKGASRDGVFEQNLIVCSQAFSGGIRLGLSFGGGGTAPDRVCEGGDCSIEHIGGTMRNNVILGCSDVGIYINECQDCTIAHNTVYDTGGIDFRFAATRVTAFGNLHSGRMRHRDGATSDQSGNLELSVADFGRYFEDPAGSDFSLVDGSAFVDMGAASAVASHDFCGNLRNDRMFDLGGVEYDGDGPCDTTRTHPEGAPSPPMDAGVDAGPGSDAGAGRDGGPGAGGDGGPAVDGSVDAGRGIDGGPGFDVGPGFDAGSAPDAGPAGDVGGMGSDGGMGGDEGGCSVSFDASRGGSVILLALGLIAWRRRRHCALH